MNADEIKTFNKALNELNESYADFLRSLKETIKEVKSAKKLWRNGEKPWLIKLGFALIAFPDPTISDVVGGLLVAVGTVQEGIRRHSLYVDDIPKTFQGILRELKIAEESISRKSC